MLSWCCLVMAVAYCFRTFQVWESASREVIDDVHFLVGDADDIDRVGANQIENYMLAFREAVVAFADIRSVLAKLRVFSKPVKTSINTH